jgi:hypothetical protein
MLSWVRLGTEEDGGGRGGNKMTGRLYYECLSVTSFYFSISRLIEVKLGYTRRC